MSDDTVVPIDKARREKSSRSSRAPVRAPNDNRPTIRLEVGELERTVSDAERALIDADRGVYQRANVIVGVGTAPVITADRQRILARQILPLGEHRLLELVMSSACFEKWDGRANAFVPANVPMTVIKALEQRRGTFRLPPLSGLVNAPTMRDDGSLLTVAGYDRATGLLYDPGTDSFPEIPNRPSKSDAEVALRSIEEMLRGFPFVSDADRSVALAVILTATVRRCLRTAPAFVITAPVPGSGKSKIVDIASVIATGREAGVISQGTSDEETEKRIAALLLSGSAIALDNVEHGIGGDLLCQIMTQTAVRMRILGRSETPEMPTNVMVTATGNNVAVLGDMARRALVCRLDPKCERPELRSFDFEPVTKAKAGRGDYLAAALTALRAFHVAGRPCHVGRLGSFEEWSDLVRGCLLWLGRADPVDTMDACRTCDPRLEALRAVITQWHAVIGSEPVTAGEAIRRAAEEQTSNSGRGKYRHPEFHEALISVADSGPNAPTRLGTWIGKHKGRIVDGLRFTPSTAAKGNGRWTVVLR